MFLVITFPAVNEVSNFSLSVLFGGASGMFWNCRYTYENLFSVASGK